LVNYELRMTNEGMGAKNGWWSIWRV